MNNSRGGLLLNENQRVTVSDNLITNNGAGISLHISSNNSISGNAIADNNGVGIYLSESSNNNFLFGNNVTNNEHGVQIENCNGNIFYHNNFISNTVQASVTSGYANIWDDGYPSCGNYWSDYAGVDADSDGIGDTPYIIDASNQDRYPLVSSFQEEYLLNVNVVGSGSVALNNTGPYIYGDVVELTAVPDSGWTFSGWSGDLTGSVNPETIVMNGDKTVTANFIVPNTPPYQPQLSITPSLAVEDNDDLVVTVTGPTPADPDRDSVTYTYRWFVNVGTGGFVDDEVAGRGDHTGNTVPAADTVVGDIWRVEVTPVDEHGTAGASAIAEWQIVVDATKPVAHAGPDRTVNEDTQVTFDGSSSTDNVGIVSYVWAFTDVTPKTLTGKNPIYTFATPGTYTVTLNVTDAAGNWDSDAVIITVSPVTPSDGSGQDGTGQDGTQSSTTPPDVAKPVANAGPDKLVVEDNVVSFDAGGSSDNTGIVSYEWDFGDGTAGTGITVTHTYAKSGNYTVTLTVKDAAGNSQTASISVTVQRDTDGDGVPDVTDTDDDNDGMSDAWEIENELDPIDAQDASLDPDADGLTNLEEYQQGMNPNVSDARPLSTLALAIGGFTAATTAILVSLTGVGKAFDSAISKLPIPDELKQFLQLYGEKLFETVDKAKLEAIEKAAFITRGEVIALGASALIATIVFGSEEANGVLNFLTLSGFVNFLPSVLVSVCVVIIFTELFETCCARTCKVHKQFRLWMYGIIMFLASGIVFHFPVGSPGITRYKSGEISKKAKGLFVLSKMLLLLTLAIPFTALVMMGFNVIGELGLWITLTTVFSSLIPLRPLVGKALFDYRKEVSLTALAVSGVLLFSFVYSRLTYVTFLPYVTYLAAGAVSAVLAAITLTQLRKAHPT